MGWWAQLWRPKPKPPKPESPMVDLSPVMHDIAVAEFKHDTFVQIRNRMGIYDVTQELRDDEGRWLAEIGYCKITGTYYRTRRSDL